MAYQRMVLSPTGTYTQPLDNGDVLEDAHIKHIEDGIVNLETESSDNLEQLEDRIESLHSLIDYNFQAPYSDTHSGCTHTREGTIITLNGQQAGGTVQINVIVNGTYTFVNSGTEYSELTHEGLSLLNNHKYRLSLKRISGSMTRSATNQQYPNQWVYAVPLIKAATDTPASPASTVVTRLGDAYSSYTEFTYLSSECPNGVYIAYKIARASSNYVTFTNCKFAIELEDLTGFEESCPCYEDLDYSATYGVNYSAAAESGFTVRKLGNHVEINGVSTNSQTSMYTLVNYFRTAASTAETLTNPYVKMEKGHTYRLRAVVHSGTITKTSSNADPHFCYVARNREDSAYQYAGDLLYNGSGTSSLLTAVSYSSYPFVMEATYQAYVTGKFGFCLQCYKNDGFSNLVFDFYIDDISSTAQSKNIAQVENGVARCGTHDGGYQPGELLVNRGNVYEATANIAAGANLVPGSTGNMVATTIDKQLTKRDNINKMLHSLVDYNSTKYSGTPTNASGITYTRDGMRFTLNGTVPAPGSSTIWFRINGDPSVAVTTSGTWANWTNPLVLTVGHRYILRLRSVSGTMTNVTSAYLGAYNNGSDLVSTAFWEGENRCCTFTYESTYTGVNLALAFARTSDFRPSFSNWAFDITLEDITNSDWTCANFAPMDIPVAKSEHAAGSLLTLGGRLYQVGSTGIPIGGNITPGTNVTATSVSNQLEIRDAAISAIEENLTNQDHIMDERINALHGLVDYGYTGRGVYNGTYTYADGTLVTSNGTFSANTVYAFVRLSGTDSGSRYAGSYNVLRGFPGAITLKDGHLYRWYMLYESGSVTSSQAHPIMPGVYPSGADTNIASRYYLNDGSSYGEFTYSTTEYPDGVHLCITYNRTSGLTISNWKASCILVDETEYGIAHDTEARTQALLASNCAYGLDGWGGMTASKEHLGYAYARTANRIVINGSGTGTTNAQVCVTGASGITTQNSDDSHPDNLVNANAVLLANHVYLVSVRYVSGSVAKTGSNAFNICFYVKYGTDSVIRNNFTANMYDDFSSGTREWQNYICPSDNTALGLGFYQRSGYTFTDFMLEFNVEDITDKLRTTAVGTPETRIASRDYAEDELVVYCNRLFTAKSAIQEGTAFNTGSSGNLASTTLIDILSAKDTAIAAEATARAAGDDAVDARVDACLNGLSLIDYGLGVERELSAITGNLSTASVSFDNGVFLLTGSLAKSTTTVKVYVDYGRWLVTAGTGSMPSGSVQGVTLVNGHTYRIRMEHISGSYSGDNTYVSPVFLKPGSVAAQGTDAVLVYDASTYDHGIFAGVSIGRNNDSEGITFSEYGYKFRLIVEDITGGQSTLPAIPSSDGTYTLKVTVSSGVPTYSWAADT